MGKRHSIEARRNMEANERKMHKGKNIKYVLIDMCLAHAIEARRNMEANESKKAYKLKGKNIKYCLY